MQPVYQFGDFRLETAQARLLRHGTNIPLSPKVFDTLLFMVENAGRLLPKDELMQRVWPNTFVEEMSLAQNISQLRKALGEGAGDAHIIETVAKRGYRFAAPVQVVSDGQPSNGNATASVHAAEPIRLSRSDDIGPGKVNSSRKVAAALAATVLILVSVGYFAVSRQKHGQASVPIHSIAVLPLANLSADPEQEFFADGVTDDLITELARIRALRVISRTSVMQYKGTRKPLPEIARELNVDAVVEGTVSQRNGRVHITAQFIQANPEQHVWAETYERPLAEAQSLSSEIARAIAGAVQATMTPEEQARMRRSRATNPEANILYLKGRYFWNKRTPEGVKEGEKYFHEAIARDSDFAQAYVGLADAYIFQGGWGTQPATVVLPRAETAVRQALVLDPDNAEAHAALGLIAMNYEWDWPKAEREYKTALALNPNDAIAHHWYSEYLAAQGRFDEALGELRRAEELDPLSVAIGADRGKILYFARRYGDAITQLNKTLEMDPAFLNSYHWLVRAYLQKGMQSEAQATLDRLRRVGGESIYYQATVSRMRGTQGRRQEVKQIMRTIDRAALVADPGQMLQMQMAMGNTSQAFTSMEKCYATHSTAMTSLKVNPDYDDLRGDPRFALYLERVRLSN
jgi:TolB-like protein/DNA-binding winged helix-turn-helix (wHTH) protein/Tfp pilus assembly protein PilF